MLWSSQVFSGHFFPPVDTQGAIKMFGICSLKSLRCMCPHWYTEALCLMICSLRSRCEYNVSVRLPYTTLNGCRKLPWQEQDVNKCWGLKPSMSPRSTNAMKTLNSDMKCPVAWWHCLSKSITETPGETSVYSMTYRAEREVCSACKVIHCCFIQIVFKQSFWIW